MSKKKRFLLWAAIALMVFALSFPLTALFQTSWQELRELVVGKQEITPDF